MPKSLSERIAHRVKLVKKPSRNAINLAAFLAVRQDIEQAIVDGWSLKNIWEVLHDEKKIPFCYSAFVGYVKRLILIPQTKMEATAITVSNTTTQNTNKPSGIPGFHFNTTPNKEELL